jgi:hypothetical protein
VKKPTLPHECRILGVEQKKLGCADPVANWSCPISVDSSKRFGFLLFEVIRTDIAKVNIAVIIQTPHAARYIQQTVRYIQQTVRSVKRKPVSEFPHDASFMPPIDAIRPVQPSGSA